jgi:hypothetical protein
LALAGIKDMKEAMKAVKYLIISGQYSAKPVDSKAGGLR